VGFERHASGPVVISIVDPVAVEQEKSIMCPTVVSSFHSLIQVGPAFSVRLLYRSMRWLAGIEEAILRCIIIVDSPQLRLQEIASRERHGSASKEDVM
jgi:hypothetical protein